MERKSLTSILSSSLYFLPGCFMMLLILAVQSAKIRFYIEKAIFLFNFYDKSLEVSILFLIFATDSVSPFVWVSGLFTGKGRYGTLSLKSSNLANLNSLLEDTATRTSTMGVLYPFVLEHIVTFCNGVVIRGIL